MSATATLGPHRPTVGIRGRRYPVLLPRLSDARLHLAAVIVSLQVLGQAGFAFRVSIAQILVSVGTCALLEVGIVFARQRVLVWPASALLTGNGTAFILRVPGTRHGDWWTLRGAWIFAAAAAVGLLSKHVVRYRGRHVFNPSNIGLVLCFLVLGSGRAEPLDFWWGPMSGWLAVAIGIIVIGGLAILARLRLLAIAVGFWIAFALGLAIVGASGHSMTARWHLGPVRDWTFWWALVSSPEILVFLFFMITDPKTVPAGRRGRVGYTVAVGLLAALLVAPMRTEFGAKVAVLGALAVVCAARPLIELLSTHLARHRRRVTALALCGTALYVPAIVAAGIPARSSASLPQAIGAVGPLEVTVAQSSGVASKLDLATARRVAGDAVLDLRVEAEALRRGDAARAGAAAGGARLLELRRLIGLERSGRAVAVPAYHVRRARVDLRPGNQGGATLLVTLAGTVESATYAGSPPRVEGRSAPAPFEQTFQISPGRTRYLIVAQRGASSSLLSRGTPSTAGGRSPITFGLLPVRGSSTAQGTPFVFRVDARDSAATTLPAQLELRLVAPDGRSVLFSRGTIVVPGKGRSSRRVRVIPSQWFARLGAYRVAASADGRAVGSLGFSVTQPTVEVPRFRDVTTEAGLRTSVPAPSCGTFTNGAAFGDVNGDGFPDLFVTRLGQPAQLFLNDGHGRFRRDATAGVAVRNAVAAAFGDYDNDGHEDLYVTRSTGADLLFHNDGNGRFTDVTRSAGITNDSPGASVSWGDYNGDGRLDVYVTSYIRCVGKWTTPYALTSRVRYFPDRLYRNDGGGRFTDATSLLGRKSTNGAGFASIWFDYNGDNRPDLYLGNDFIGGLPDANHLWQNDGRSRGGWSFTDVSAGSETNFFANTMGIGAADFDRDQRLDLALSDIGANKLLLHRGTGRFTDIASSAGVARPTQRVGTTSVTWGVGAYDFNLDGWDDLYFAAGNVLSRRGVQPNEVFVNDGTGRRFLDLSAPSGAADPGDSKGAAFADVDRDGRMDVFVVDQGGTPRLYRNVTPRGRNHWLEIATQGTQSNRDGCGARLFVTLPSGARLISQVFCSGNDRVVHFGLGTAASVTRLEVAWPSGERTELQNLAVDRLLTVTEAMSDDKERR